MSRRSILLATTFYIAIGSFAAVGPVSAHGFGPGGFSGGPSGPALAARSPTAPGVSNIGRTPVQPMNNLGGSTKLDHVPSIATPAAQGNISGPRIEPTRIPAVTNATIPNSPAVMQSPRPAQLSPTITSSGIGLHQPVDAAGIVTAPLQNRVSAAGIVSAPVTARYPVNQPSGTEQGPSSRIIGAEGDGKPPKPGSTEGVPNATSAPRIIGQDPSLDHITDSQRAAIANARPVVDTLTQQYLIPSAADLAKSADEAREKRLADLRQKKDAILAQIVAVQARILGIEMQANEADAACKAEVAALEQMVQKSAGDAGEAAGAVIGGVVGGPLGAAAGAVVGATIGDAAAEVATNDLSGCKREADLLKQIPDLLSQMSPLKAALAGVDAAIAEVLKEQTDEARQQAHNARIGSLGGPSRPQGATR